MYISYKWISPKKETCNCGKPLVEFITYDRKRSKGRKACPWCEKEIVSQILEDVGVRGNRLDEVLQVLRGEQLEYLVAADIFAGYSRRYVDIRVDEVTGELWMKSCPIFDKRFI